MAKLFARRRLINSILAFSVILLPTYLLAATNDYTSELLNESNQNNSKGYILIKTREWPTKGCLIETGDEVIYPGESTLLKIKHDDKKCSDSGVGYEIYRTEDTKKENLLGYLSHRLGAGKFSVQISRFCEGDKCVFKNLNPAQDR
jgi:hypothetical protein